MAKDKPKPSQKTKPSSKPAPKVRQSRTLHRPHAVVTLDPDLTEGRGEGDFDPGVEDMLRDLGASLDTFVDGLEPQER